MTQNRPYDDRKVWIALGEHGISIDTFDDVGIEIVYDAGGGDRAGATVHATFVWTASADDVSAALDASESVADDQVSGIGVDASVLGPQVTVE